MLDNTKTQTYFREPSWFGNRDELQYFAKIGLHGWWDAFEGAWPMQERVLRTFGYPAIGCFTA